MVTAKDYGEFETAWCPGCGNFSIRKAVVKALAALDLPPHKAAFSTGIGQAAKAPHYIRVNTINGLHGRSLPAATGIKLANPDLAVFAESGDGCSYGEGGNHFLAALRRNVDMTCIVHDNQIYGLTKGQASPTTMMGQKTKTQPHGVASAPFNPVAVAVTMGAGFVARGFAGEIDHLADLIVQAARHPGFSLVDVLQPCVSFNKVNTFAWYKERCYKLGGDHDPANFQAALAKAMEFGDNIPIGVLWKSDRPAFPLTEAGPLAAREPDMAALAAIIAGYA
ncbi:pyruvate ferredoxin/flavodoxin oxidoreductase, beta subunit [Solidesulfovibrio fructosivorans JJ]]|uniref:Pyruvate ferredoxin/flavodoxin oxidoreductase, beta subunit n=1 Tax=Solidesulfovibrio fructosivorans JJ] TaxID=596151 RepID=E1K0X4_SOLFR|nr:2-oxoacid:ferredoxin oxidoreductase subunit beta [Solidesulfovibrio fructosivorans]EFL49739.1 pyruvate ferredoxin/flavodoxin oxidoreductase, beta subunit [Solidesulfovibrio fructosivorans JJ]]